MAKKADIFDMNRDAETHSDGQMSVKKVLKKPALIMKSYHSAKDGEKFAKKFGYKVSNYVKTFNGSRMDIVKEETEKKFKSKYFIKIYFREYWPKLDQDQITHSHLDYITSCYLRDHKSYIREYSFITWNGWSFIYC